jgi:hydrogenase small subunit
MEGNPTGAMGLPDYLGWDFKTKAGILVVCVPGCPTQPDNLTETLLYLLYQAAGRAPAIPLDEKLRPRWLFGETVHEGCDRRGFYEQAQFAEEYGSRYCIVKLGCWGPVVQCNVGKRGWTGGVGGKMAEMKAQGLINFCLTVPTSSIHRIQESHLTLYHIIWDVVHEFFQHKSWLES